MIVENENDFRLLKSDIGNSDIVLIPMLSDIHRHTSNNSLGLLYVYSIASKNDYLILYNHMEKSYDCDLLGYLKTFENKIYTPDKKQLLLIQKLKNVIDVSLMAYMSNGSKFSQEAFDTEAHLFFRRRHYDYENINQLIPAVKHIERLQAELQNLLKIIAECGDILDSTTFKIYNDIVIQNYYQIEKNGLFIDKQLFRNYFSDKARYHLNGSDFVYSDYNIYTRTGRPSNSFAGVNFAALNKDDGCRSMIKSRFDKGILVEFDFDAYHLRLIAGLIGYNFPSDMTVHEYLGRQYLGKDTLTQEEYELSKSISFQLLYGGISEEFEQIPFFKMLKEHIYKIWDRFERVGYVESALFKRKIHKSFFTENNKYKLWNYIIQLHETENNSVLLYRLSKEMKQFKSKLILCTYDSFLFDMNFDDGTAFIEKIKEVLQDDGKSPVKMKYGTDYHNMKKN